MNGDAEEASAAKSREKNTSNGKILVIITVNKRFLDCYLFELIPGGMRK